ncbi:MAG: hypothetical protein R6V50_07705, partial [Thermoplasmatota archaeon]
MNKKNGLLNKKSIFTLLCLGLLVFSTLSSVGNIVELDTEKQIDGNNLIYTFSFKEPTFEPISVDNIEFTKLNMQGCISIGRDIGLPMMPIKSISMLLPPMTTISAITVTGNPQTVKLGDIDLIRKPIMPMQADVPIGHDPLQEFSIDTT